MSKKYNSYLPRARTDYAPESHSLESCSPDGTVCKLPSTVLNDIVVNNISTAEFDYTQELDHQNK